MANKNHEEKRKLFQSLMITNPDGQKILFLKQKKNWMKQSKIHFLPVMQQHNTRTE